MPSTYDEVVADVAEDLAIEEADLREWFSTWLNLSWQQRVDENWQGTVEDAACYAVYRLTKFAGALDMAMRSVERRGGDRAERDGLRAAGDQLAAAVDEATAPGRTRTHAMKSLPAALRRYREAAGGT